MGYDAYALENYGTAFATYSISVAADAVIWIGISTDSADAANIDFAISFVEGAAAPEADGSEANPYTLAESNTCEFPGGYNYVFYTYAVEANGTVTITVSGDDFYWGYGSAPYALNTANATTATASFEVVAGETLWIGMSTNSAAAGTITF